jgi:hypothetical protein
VVDFKGGDEASSNFPKLFVVDAHEILDFRGPPYGGYELALLDPLPSFARVLVVPCARTLVPVYGDALSYNLWGGPLS